MPGSQLYSQKRVITLTLPSCTWFRIYFQKNKESRSISLNAQYMVLFKNPRDTSQISHLVKQMYPGKVKLVQESFENATKVSYGYLVIDLKQETPEQLRLRTSIFPDDGVQYVYLPKT